MEQIYTVSSDNRLIDHLELSLKIRDDLIGHCSCSFYPTCKEIEIHDLYVIAAHRKKRFMDLLLENVFQFAKEHDAASIRAYCGPEPLCPGGQIPLAEEMDFYTGYGFKHISDVCGVIPCMIRA